MKLEEAIAWLTTEGQFDTEGHCCPKSSEAVNTLLDALRNGAIFTFEEVVPKAFHDKCMQIEIAKRRELERPKGKWLHGGAFPHHVFCSVCYKTYVPNDRWQIWVDGDLPRDFCPNCGADMR